MLGRNEAAPGSVWVSKDRGPCGPPIGKLNCNRGIGAPKTALNKTKLKGTSI